MRLFGRQTSAPPRSSPRTNSADRPLSSSQFTAPGSNGGPGTVAASFAAEIIYPPHIAELVAHYRAQESNVNIVLKCREKKQLTDEECCTLVEKYAHFHVIADEISSRNVAKSAAVSEQQRVATIVNALRVSTSTLIEELELLLIIGKDIYESTLPFHEEFRASLSFCLAKVRPLIQSVLILREQQFVDDLRSRTATSERSSTIRNFIVSMNNLIDTYHDFIAESQRRIDLSKVYIEQVDFSGLHLANVHLGGNSIRHCNFLDCELTARQLIDVKGLKEVLYIDSALMDSVLALRFDMVLTRLRSAEKGLEEMRETSECLSQLTLFVFEPPILRLHDANADSARANIVADLATRLQYISTHALARIVFLLCTDFVANAIDDIALLPSMATMPLATSMAATVELSSNGRFGRQWVTERGLVALQRMERDVLVDGLVSFIQARKRQLPAEVILILVDRQIDVLRDQLETLSRLPSELQPMSAVLSKTQWDTIITHVDGLEKFRQELVTSLDSLQSSNDQQRLAVFLSGLNAPVDERLHFTATERLQHVLSIVRHTKQVLDLRDKDLSTIDFDQIDLSHIYLCLSKQQEQLYLSDEHIEQRYALLFETIREEQSTVSDVQFVLQSCNLDVNYLSTMTIVDGITALMQSALHGRLDFVQLLVEQYGAKLDAKTTSGWDVLSLLCASREQDGHDLHSQGNGHSSGATAALDDEVKSLRSDAWSAFGGSSANHANHNHSAYSVLSSATDRSRALSSTSWRLNPNNNNIAANMSFNDLTGVAEASPPLDETALTIVDYLRARGAYLSVHNAARLGDLNMLKSFHRSELTSHCPLTGWTIAHIASRDNNVEMIRFLHSKAFDFTVGTSSPSSSIASGNGTSNATLSSSTLSQSVATLTMSSISSASHSSKFPSTSVSSLPSAVTTAGSSMSNNISSSPGPTSLWIACKFNSREVANELVELCPALREMPFNGETPIKTALQSRHLSLVRDLKRCGCVVDMEVAIAMQDEEWIREHLQGARLYGAQSHTNPSQTVSQGNSSFSQSNSTANSIARNTSNNSLYAMPRGQGSIPQRALWLGCQYGWERLVKHLIEEHEDEVDLNKRYIIDESQPEVQERVIDLAVRMGNVSLVQLLLCYAKTRYDIDEYRPASPSLVRKALDYRQWDILSLILDRQPALNVLYLGQAPLHVLLMMSDVDDTTRYDLTRKMLQCGADVLLFDAEGNSPLHFAAAVNEDIVALIVRAFVSVKNKFGKDALDVATSWRVDVPSLRF